MNQDTLNAALGAVTGSSIGLATVCAYYWHKAARANVDMQIRHGKNVAELVARTLRVEQQNDRLKQRHVETLLALAKASDDIEAYTLARKSARFTPAALKVVTEFAESGVPHAEVTEARAQLIGEDGL